MDGTAGSNGVAGHFGRELRRTRKARGWPVAEVARRTKINAGHLSRIELGRRPPTEHVAAALDEVFPERGGWFSAWHGESQSWPEIPATFRSWPDYEDRATAVRDWTPSIMTGLIQTEDYAAALIATTPGIDAATADSRLRSRVERQRRFWDHERPVVASFVVDEHALYRRVGSPQVMAVQLLHLLAVADRQAVTVQVMPAVAHPALASGFLIADAAVWCEHIAGGYVFTDEQTLTAVAIRHDNLRGESYRVSESLALIRRTAGQWETGASPPTQPATAGIA
jgi:transcriptional regulator with XRE-family HTH domain